MMPMSRFGSFLSLCLTWLLWQQLPTLLQAADDVAIAPNLPFGDINVIYVTDVHSHIGGHPHDEDRTADYGDVLSFYQHVKAYCDAQGSDLWFMMNGDWVHGTGLAMDGNATMLVPLLKHMPWDAINLGNHETYKSAVVELMRDDFIPHFGDAFLTSNTVYSDTLQPFGQHYRLLEGKNNTLLVFGFLYNLHNPSELLHVNFVEDTLEEEWFRQVLREAKYDAICVLAHMDNDDPLIAVILNKIREHTDDDMPVQFLTGDSHLRKSRKVEKNLYTHATEAGGFLDTIGFISFPTQATAQSLRKGLATSLFQESMLNASKKVLLDAAGVDVLLTDEGSELSSLINETRHVLGLDEVIGCPTRDYFINRSIHEEDSIFKLWMDHVVPTQVFKEAGDHAMIISSDNFRYDIRRTGVNDGMTVDDIVYVAPYMEPVIYVGDVPEWAVRRVNESLNQMSNYHKTKLPDYLLVGKFEVISDHGRKYKLYTLEYNLPEVLEDLTRMQVDVTPTKTDLKDTLYWLNYSEQRWPCKGDDHPKNVKPWFTDIKELDEETSDGEFTDENAEAELEIEIEEEIEEETHEENNPASDLHYEGFQGYLPPSTIEQYSDVLPPAVSPSAGQKPPDPTPAPTPPPTKHKIQASDIVAIRDRRTRIRKRIFRGFGIVVACVLMMVPAWGLYRVFFPAKEKNEMDDEIFYDMKEMRAARRRAKRGGDLQGHKPLPMEIQIS
eukprot:Nitzschia sp. Nitz4//scaffold46_size129759//94628//96796//NITZ4_003517-RA/size129759-processed-gene-0.147-mRNA-1//1//CDS//3329552643//7193//frame0